jgi:hypothetical protein
LYVEFVGALFVLVVIAGNRDWRKPITEAMFAMLE